MKRLATVFFSSLAVLAALLIGWAYTHQASSPTNQPRAPYLNDAPEAQHPYRRKPLAAQHQAPFSALPIASTYQEPWERIGPVNFGGKVMDVAVNPQDANTVFAAYVGGGIWKSTDGGRSWEQVTDIARNNQFSCLEIWEGNPDVIFAGLGIPGEVVNADQGILKSTDGGRTWNRIGPDFSETMGVYRIEVDPENVDVIFAATPNAIYKTTDGGNTWFKVLSYEGENWWNDLPDLVMHPTDPNILYVAQRNIDIMVTRDGGATWQDASDGLEKNGLALVLTLAPSDPTIMYAEREVDAPWPSPMDVYRSDDGGQHWQRTIRLEEYHQGRYDMALSVDPTDPNHVVIANAYLYESSDGTQTVQFPRQRSPHPDHLAAVFSPSDPDIVYSGNDGGVWKSQTSAEGLAEWEPADIGVQTNLTFSFGLDPHSERIYASAGDWIGALVYTGDPQWDLVYGAGTEWEYYYVDPYNNEYVYYGHSWDHHRMRVGADGKTFTERTMIDPDPDGPGSGYWQRLRFHPSQEGTIYAASNRLFRSDDRGDTWTSISPVLPANADWGLSDFDIAPTDPDRIYAFSWSEYKTHTTTDGGATWETLDAPTIYAAAIAISPTDAETFYVGHPWGLYKFTEGGARYEHISGNLSDLPIRKIIVDPQNPARLFVGTNAGVFVTDKEGTSWEALGSGLPRLEVWDMGLRKDGLYVSGTQGMWRYKLLPTVALISPAPNASVATSAITLAWESVEDATQYDVEVATTPGFTDRAFEATALEETTVSIPALAPSTTYYWRVRARNEDREGLWSQPRRFTTTTATSLEEITGAVPTTFALHQNYPNPFNPTTTISFDVPTSAHVTLAIYNVQGQHVATLVSDRLPAGRFSYPWDASGLPSGVYLYRLQAGHFQATKRLTLLK